MAHQYLRQRMIACIRSRLSSGEFGILRQFYTLSRGSSSPRVSPEKRRITEKTKLYQKLWAAGSEGTKMSDVLDELKKQGRNLTKAALVSCVKDLRKFFRYQSCFEILQWVEEHINDISDGEHALRLSVIYKLKGIDEAEKYFASLPPAAKTRSTYGALLNCYCMDKSIEKALSHFKEMEELKYANIVAFNNLMGLYMKVGQPEKVPPLVEEMKLKGVELINYSYCVLIQSYGCLRDIDGVERVANEVESQYKTNMDWNIYGSLAVAYITVGQSEKAELALKKMERFLDNSYNPDRLAYHHLMNLWSKLDSLEQVTRVWAKLKSRFRHCNNSSYFNMLLSLSRLDDIEGMKKCLQEWELGPPNSYDARLPMTVVDACLKREMIDDAERLLEDATKKAGEGIWKSHVSMIKYYLENHKIDSALMHMELAISSKWKQFRGSVNMFLEYFIKEKDVDGAEKFCHMLKKAEALDSEAYMGLLQTYAVAEKRAPEMRSRMEKDGVDIEPKHEELLQKICPN